MRTDMFNEDAYFTKGPGRYFRKPAEMMRRGADESLTAAVAIRSLRKEIRKHGGPAELESLALTTGLISASDCLPLGIVSADEMQEWLYHHRRKGMLRNRARQAECEAKVIEREWERVRQQSGAICSQHNLCLDWCMEHVRAVFLDRIEPCLLESSPAARLAKIQSFEEHVRERLLDPDADILASLVENPSGSRIRVREGKVQPTTAEILHMSLSDLGAEL
jgi:hypothetical protein